MKVSEIKNSISSLPGIGKQTSTLFAKLNVFTVGDLLQYYPRTYEDRTEKVPIANFRGFDGNAPKKVHTIAKVIAHEWFGYGRMKTLKLIINDGSATGELICFNRPFMEKACPVNSIVSVTGKFDLQYGKIQSTSFEAERLSYDGDLIFYKDAVVPGSKVYPIYPLTEGLSQKILQKSILSALNSYGFGIDDEIPENIRIEKGLLKKSEALIKIHNPKNILETEEARKTLVFEELYNFQKVIALQTLAHKGRLSEIDSSGNDGNSLSSIENIFGGSIDSKKSNDSETSKSIEKSGNGNIKKTEESFSEIFEQSLSPRQKQLMKKLPFSLTDDQKKVIFQMNREIDSNYGFGENKNSALRSLLQGDVGSGKTLVCFFAALRTIDYGGQCAIMAPTEILARQHAENAAKLLSDLESGVSVAFLTGNIKSSGRGNLLAALKNGEINLVIGTHALFSKNVEYKDLSFVVIDEQHRFGVLQRNAIFDKGRLSRKGSESENRETNLLMMSATPIPQSLALTIFGDLDVLAIRTMPEGRLPVKTYLTRSDHVQNAYEEVRKQLKMGHQAYFVYPAIENNFSEDDFAFENDNAGKRKVMKAAEEMAAYLKEKVYPEYNVALIHGKIDDEQQSQILHDFKSGKIQVLVATTVVEVGVDVPNATCIVIEMAERFGLSALHQLRGRVGRGKDQSFCFLIYSQNITENGIARMKALHETTDGFKIAEEDLKLRGPGEINGTMQSGDLEFKIADIRRDMEILMDARRAVFKELSER